MMAKFNAAMLGLLVIFVVSTRNTLFLTIKFTVGLHSKTLSQCNNKLTSDNNELNENITVVRYNVCCMHEKYF